MIDPVIRIQYGSAPLRVQAPMKESPKMFRFLVLSVAVLVLTGCSGFGAVVPGPAPDPGMTGFEARAVADGYAEYAAMAGPNLPLTPTYKVHGKATAVATTIVPYLTLYLEGDAWVEPTPAGDSAVSVGQVVIYRAGKRVQTGWSRQTAPAAATPPSGRRTYYTAPPASLPIAPTAAPCVPAPVGGLFPSACPPTSTAYVACRRISPVRGT